MNDIHQYLRGALPLCLAGGQGNTPRSWSRAGGRKAEFMVRQSGKPAPFHSLCRVLSRVPAIPFGATSSRADNSGRASPPGFLFTRSSRALLSTARATDPRLVHSNNSNCRSTYRPSADKDSQAEGRCHGPRNKFTIGSKTDE